ncbi:MAG: hypothetical protein FWF24_04925 [Alphaproteobacteria bacterium]|nr:hypothetical protein [Alphaproteobacteria bacterium]
MQTALRVLLLVFGIFFGFSSSSQAQQPLGVVSSAIAGISFDDPPLVLPIQRNFQMAMLTSSSALGRTCGRMEAYGWRVDAQEQNRVDNIFNTTVDRLLTQDFTVEAKAASGISDDVTLFTADRADKNLIMLWSAGDIGLVMVLCETSAPLRDSVRDADTLAMAESVRPGRSASWDARNALAHADFSPVGKWEGSYACEQGFTGATLHIEKVKDGKFDGLFSFFPTEKNPDVPAGSYRVSGEYDEDTLRILINPGKWIKQPEGFQNTIIIGSFDPVRQSFSGFFQGITGCTSFEAMRHEVKTEVKKAAVKKPAPQKAPVKKKPVVTSKPLPPASTLETPSGIVLDR